MIRQYEEKDLSDLLDAWYSASLVAHPLLDEVFFEQERKNISEIYLPNAETWVFEQDGVVVGFISLIGNPPDEVFASEGGWQEIYPSFTVIKSQHCSGETAIVRGDSLMGLLYDVFFGKMP